MARENREGDQEGASLERAGLKPGTEPYPDGKVLWLMVRARLGPFPVSRFPLPAETHACYFPVKAMSCQGHSGGFSWFFLGGFSKHADRPGGTWGPRTGSPSGIGLTAGPYGTAEARHWPCGGLTNAMSCGNAAERPWRHLQAGTAPVTCFCQVRRLLRARPCPSRHRQATAPGT